MPSNRYDIKKILLFLSLIQHCLFLSPVAFANSRFATDELSIANQYAYRLITRQMATNPAHHFSDNVKPISFREIAKLNSNNNAIDISTQMTSQNAFYSTAIQHESDSDGKLFQPIKEFNFHNTRSSKENANIYANFGERFDGKQLTAISAYGNFYFNNYFVASHETRLDSDKNSNTLSLYKFRLKSTYERYSLSYAKESLVLGPGHFGNLLLSNNVEPEITTMLKIEDPYKLPYLGYLRFYLWHIAYEDQNRVNRNPNLLGFRLSVKPNKFFEASLTRTTYYGGTNNDTVTSIKDIIKLITAEDENAETTINTDQLAAMDLSLYIPGIHKYSPFIGGKFYTERVWNDVHAFWQAEDKSEGALFKLLGTSFLHGVFLTTGKLDFHLEYVKTTNFIYAHSNFGRDGLTDNAYIIGHFIGRDAKAYLSELYYEFTPKIHGLFQAGYLVHGLNLNKQRHSTQYGTGVNYFHSNQWHVGLNINYIMSDRTDIDDSPVVYDFADQSNTEIQGLMKVTYFLN